MAAIDHARLALSRAKTAREIRRARSTIERAERANRGGVFPNNPSPVEEVPEAELFTTQDML